MAPSPDGTCEPTAARGNVPAVPQLLPPVAGVHRRTRRRRCARRLRRRRRAWLDARELEGSEGSAEGFSEGRLHQEHLCGELERAALLKRHQAEPVADVLHVSGREVRGVAIEDVRCAKAGATPALHRHVVEGAVRRLRAPAADIGVAERRGHAAVCQCVRCRRSDEAVASHQERRDQDLLRGHDEHASGLCHRLKLRVEEDASRDSGAIELREQQRVDEHLRVMVGNVVARALARLELERQRQLDGAPMAIGERRGDDHVERALQAVSGRGERFLETQHATQSKLAGRQAARHKGPSREATGIGRVHLRRDGLGCCRPTGLDWTGLVLTWRGDGRWWQEVAHPSAEGRAHLPQLVEGGVLAQLERYQLGHVRLHALPHRRLPLHHLPRLLYALHCLLLPIAPVPKHALEELVLDRAHHQVLAQLAVLALPRESGAPRTRARGRERCTGDEHLGPQHQQRPGVASQHGARAVSEAFTATRQQPADEVDTVRRTDRRPPPLVAQLGVDQVVLVPPVEQPRVDRTECRRARWRAILPALCPLRRR